MWEGQEFQQKHGCAGKAHEAGGQQGKSVEALLGCSRTIAVTPPAGQDMRSARRDALRMGAARHSLMGSREGSALLSSFISPTQPFLGKSSPSLMLRETLTGNLERRAISLV